MPLPCPRFLCVLAFLAASAGAGGAPAPPEYFYRTWRIEDGLTDNSVNTVLQDPQGYLWLATLFGLARFDGRQFKEFPLPTAMRDSGENIRALAQLDPATLIMLPASGGVVLFRNGQFSRHPVDAFVRGRDLRQLFVERDGVLWLADNRGGAFRWQNGKLISFGPADGLDGTIGGFSLATDAQGRTWLAQGSFLGWFEDGRLVRFPNPVGTALVVAPARDGGIWISTAKQLLKCERGQLVVQSEVPEWNASRDTVQSLFEDSRGVLWIATRRNGLFQRIDGQVRPVATEHQIVDSISEDSEQGIWVASKGGGITRLQRRRFVTIRPGPGQLDIASTSVFEDSAGTLWCANREGGVFRYVDGTVQRVADPRGEPPIYANTICPDGAGTIWVGASSGLYRVAPGRDPILEPVAPDLKQVHVLYPSREGDLWVSAGYNRLGRFRHGSFEAFSAEQGYPGKQVSAIAQTPDGTIWVAAENELLVFRNGRFVRPPGYQPPFPMERIAALYCDRAGALWIGMPRGLLRLDHGHLTTYTQAEGLPSNRVEQILEDKHGELWFNSRQGFFHVSRADLEAVAEGRLAQVGAATFGPEEGVIGEIPVFNCQPNVWRNEKGRLWFCTQEGVIGIDSDAIPLQLQTPPVYIDRILIDGRAVGSAGLHLSTSGHRLAFYFSCPSFAAPEKVRLRYRLRGFDNSWSETISGQEVNYAGLPAGPYVLEVAASDPNGIRRDGLGASLPFLVVPPWWETWWARMLALAAFTSSIAWLVRYTSHRLLKRRLHQIEQEHALEKERARIARDLHDELGGSLTRIALRADRLKRRSEKSEFGPGLNQLARQARRLTGELESIIWSVNPRNNSLDRFASFVRQFAIRFFQETDIACSVRGTETIPSLPIAPEVQHHLLTATKEALTNVLKHSRAGAVLVDLRFAAGTFLMAIRDDGVGFNVAAAEHSERNGLSNIRSRLREIGGHMEIRSSPGTGTELSWQVSLAASPDPGRAAASPSPPL